MSRDDCYSFLSHHTVGRVCFSDGRGPLALPINFRLLGPVSQPYAVIRTSSGTALGAHSGMAALEVDEIDEASHRASSVLARGMLRVVSDPHDLPDPQPWITEARDRWMVLDIIDLTGRRFIATYRPDGFNVEWQLG